MLSFTILASLMSSILARPIQQCNHFLGSPIDRCDFETQNGRFYGLFCVDSDTVEGRTYSDEACTQDMRVGHKRPCVAPYCHCGGSSDDQVCPTTSIKGTACEGSPDEGDFGPETWTHVRDICVSGPNLNTSVRSTCLDDTLVYYKFDNGICGGEGTILHCVGAAACGECDDFVEYTQSVPCVGSGKPKNETAPAKEETTEAELPKEEVSDCCSTFVTEDECNAAATDESNKCVSCGWNSDQTICEFQSRLAPLQS